MRPTINIISDSLGDSAAAVAEAAASQFDCQGVTLRRLPNVTTTEQVVDFLATLRQERRLSEVAPENHAALANEAVAADEVAPSARLIILYTIADAKLRSAVKKLLDQPDIYATDVLGPPIAAIAAATGLAPKNRPGLIRQTGAAYYHRVEAMEFAVDHDDGRNPEQLTNADIVLVGSSRTSKTPLAIYMATLGYKVANVPLVPGVRPPGQLFTVESRRIFGLMSDAALLASIRRGRLGNASGVAATYASIEYVQEDLDEARTLMRALGCIVVRTDNRAIEETAQEILRYYETSRQPPSREPPFSTTHTLPDPAAYTTTGAQTVPTSKPRNE
ncbi:MAG: kinase/pyrophosphorylase [Coriobacteriales bacterium]|nr:kinase/pyrophosphorylase [Coriobacteriales bacterium]